MNSVTQNHRIYSAQPVIIGGFVALLVLLAALFAVWYQSVEENRRVLATTSHLQSEMQLIFQIRDSASRRAVFLLRMAQLAGDPFAVDDQYIKFKDAAGPFQTAREKLLGPGASENVLRFWEKAKPLINKGGSVQIIAAQLLLNEEPEAAHEVISTEVMPAQESVLSALDDMLNAQQKTVDEQITNVQALNHRTDIILLILASSILLLGIFITIYVTRRSAQSESQLREQSHRIRSLYDVSSISGLSLDEQINEMLRLGCQLTQMKTGSLLRLIPDKPNLENQRHNEMINTINVNGQTQNELGEHLLESQLCRKNLETDTALTFDHCASDDINIPELNGKALFSSYIGISLNVHGTSFGVLNFISDQPRAKPFTHTDKDLVTLIGSWMSVTLERILEQSELADAKNIAESANRAKSSFIANMSHEIRTPLTAIIGFANSLLDPTRTDKEHADAAHTIVRSSEHLHDLINDILDLSKIEAEQLVIERMSISPLSLVAEIESVVAPRAREKGLRFNTHVEYPLPQTINSDPTRLKQILLNLCSNATKFTENGEINIHTRFDTQHRQIIFTVSDTGIGINESQITQIFQPFAQADSSTTRRFGGTGLGLWISRQLAQRLNGDISCESETGKGSIFCVRLSITDSEQLTLMYDHTDNINSLKLPTTKTPDVIPRLHGNILLAEDSPDIQSLVKLVVTKTGAKITIVDNGKKAVEMALSNAFDLILMDMQMPVMGGMEATKWLRNAGYSGPIVALTANAMKNDEDQSKAAGFDGYLTKPLITDRFYALLSKHLTSTKNPTKNIPAEKIIDEVAESFIDQLNDNDDYKELIALFVINLQQHVADIATSLETNDWELMQNISHKLKGSGSAFGYPKITEIAGLINDQLHKNIDDLPNDEFLNTVASLNDYCKTIIKNHPAPA